MFLLLFFFLPFILSSKLLLVIEVCRHGAREPVYDYWDAKSFREFGELTSVGMHQQFILGQYIQKLYITEARLFSQNYQPEEVYVRSTDLNRTITSAISQLYGLFPLSENGPILPKGIEERLIRPPFKTKEVPSLVNGTSKIWEKRFGLKSGFQPIPVLTFQEKDDQLLRSYMPRLCPINTLLEKKQKAETKYNSWRINLADTFKQIETLVNASAMTNNSVTIETASRVFDVFQADIYFNRNLPEGMTEELWKNLTFIANMNLYYVKLGSEIQKNFQATPFFEELLKDFSDKLKKESSSTYKFKLYSAHDMTLAYLLTGLNLTSYECLEEIFLTNKTKALHCFSYPEFAANMLFELYQNEETLMGEVMIRYNGEYVNLCGREEKKCDFEEFQEKLNKLMLVDFFGVCKNHAKKDDRNNFFKIINE